MRRCSPQYRIISLISSNVNSPAILALISSHYKIQRDVRHVTESLSYFNVVNSTQITAILSTRIALLFQRGQFHTKCYINLSYNIKRCLPRYRILSPISPGVNSPAISVSSSVESSLLFHPVSIHQQH